MNSNTNNKLLSLLYVSKAVRPYTMAELDDLLEKSRIKNNAAEITGLLLYLCNERQESSLCRFMQVLEGEPAPVERLYERIKQDTRHYHVTLVRKASIAVRSFGNWSMGFRRLAASEIALAQGYFEPEHWWDNSKHNQQLDIVIDYLRSFYGMHR
ncbi:BLUF domain-containing protein [Mucilaginibacter limnophilus]|uniref:BLUF domain-containing protein n=1 Tax=Mucilaginibacter limnophilus TaxID=1932778 RepID=A0A437MZ13_9SPHI|nr:BLUF domain-containing protein [Mucilaginibacter limnophilus]RVU02893.1 BLUF domain-containing protein [Mucilaginibacter limnophilus]